jgi:Domain of unknown function DUF488
MRWCDGLIVFDGSRANAYCIELTVSFQSPGMTRNLAREPVMADRIFTFGYEGLSLDAFIRRLKTEGVETVLDVRANPLSRKPGFSRRAFSTALNSASIAYMHLPAMGCPKPVRDPGLPIHVPFLPI